MKLVKESPYRNTSISVEQSQMEIQQMLKDFGCEATRWTESPDSMKGVDCPTLEFVVKSEINGIEKQIGFRIKPPLLMIRRRRSGKSGPMITTGNPKASMRYLVWKLKTTLEGVRWGGESIEEILLSRVIVQLPSGANTTVGERIIPELISEYKPGKGKKALSLLPSFTIDEPQLEEVEEDKIDERSHRS